MRKVIICIIMVCLVAGIIVLCYNYKYKHHETTTTKSSSAVEQTTDHFIDPHTIQDPGKNRAEKPVEDD